jgi:hypothetical protein
MIYSLMNVMDNEQTARSDPSCADEKNFYRSTSEMSDRGLL